MEKFSTVFIFSPPYSETGGCNCWRPDRKDCLSMQKESTEYVELDLEDIAESLMQVMRICRLRPWEVKRTKNVIKRSFRHFEEIRFRIDRVPRKRFSKENFLHDLAVEAGMGRMDSHLAYGIVKRAFQAYYHGTGEGGIRLQSYDGQMRHRSECLWLHAAKRTAEIFAVYAGLMYSEQMKYEECIKCAYLILYKELQSRFKFEKSEPKICTCKTENARVDSVWDALSGTTLMSGNTAITTELFFNKHTFDVSNPTSVVSVKAEYMMVSRTDRIIGATSSAPEEKISHPVVKANSSQNSKQSGKATEKKSEKSVGKKKKRKKKKNRSEKCKCPNLQCTGSQRPPVITAECSQGPYVCRWIPYEDTFPAHCVPCPPMESICPPCDHDDRPCDDECTCTCNVCTCPPADEFVEEEHCEKLSGSGLEDRDTDYCWLAPFRDEKVMRREVEQSLLDEELAEADDAEEELFECRCTCEYKQRAFPHLFTYLAPFKTPPVEPEVPPVEIPVKPKKPPCGISMETYRCWNEPSRPSEEEPLCPTCPHIALLAHAEKSLDVRAPTVKGISMDVTVKSQHYPREERISIKTQPRGKAGKTARPSDSVQKCAKELESNLKAVERSKGNQQATKMQDTKRQPPSVISPPAKSVPLKPVPITVPPQSKANANEPDNTQRQSDDKLTKEDILEMLGLNK
ncbi:uncharacterized protein LOC117570876 [Drosophila albomicans]|uniref:Uncharacterized protein LOC117570876 n=1 Tax=Drosophila albomicans TaxID=7291 RepID=A0A6P8XBC2_DROAB|nr:uncharacterized protein LOC117570876 [Drosophila albomicans]